MSEVSDQTAAAYVLGIARGAARAAMRQSDSGAHLSRSNL